MLLCLHRLASLRPTPSAGQAGCSESVEAGLLANRLVNSRNLWPKVDLHRLVQRFASVSGSRRPTYGLLLIPHRFHKIIFSLLSALASQLPVLTYTTPSGFCAAAATVKTGTAPVIRNVPELGQIVVHAAQLVLIKLLGVPCFFQPHYYERGLVPDKNKRRQLKRPTKV